MPHVLIVEDSPTQAEYLRRFLEQRHHETHVAHDGREALALLERAPADLVLTDLVMPEMDGLELVEALRVEHPETPVVLVTEHGSEDIAAEALRRGAVSYIPKRRLEQDLLPTLQRVLGLLGANYRTRGLLDAWVRTEAEFVLGCDPSVFPELLAYVRDVLGLLRFGDESELLRISVALSEALDNALYHGNLEIPSRLRDEGTWNEAILRRRAERPYCDRRIRLVARMSAKEAVFTVRDDGPGFDPRTVPDPTNPENLGRLSGRGIFLITTFMDEVRYNDRGNEVTLTRRAEPVPR